MTGQASDLVSDLEEITSSEFTNLCCEAPDTPTDLSQSGEGE